LPVRLGRQTSRAPHIHPAGLKGLLREVNRDIDARNLGGLDSLERALGSVIRQREIVAKLPTWPWSPGTARGFASAILLPLAIFVAQRLVSQLL
jgi:hypothetical protein